MTLPLNTYRPLVMASRVACMAPDNDEARELAGRILFEACADAWGPGEFTRYMLRLTDAEAREGQPGLERMQRETEDKALFFAAVLTVVTINADKLKTPETMHQAATLFAIALMEGSGLGEEDFARLVDPATAAEIYGEPTLN